MCSLELHFVPVGRRGIPSFLLARIAVRALYRSPSCFQGLIDAHEQFKSTLGEADREYQGIMSLSNEAQRLAQQYSLLNENPYTTLQVCL